LQQNGEHTWRQINCGPAFPAVRLCPESCSQEEFTDCPRNGEETDAGNAGTAEGYLDLPDARGQG